MNYTVEIYKDDKRIKRGRRFIKKVDVEADNKLEAAAGLVKLYPEKKGYHMVVEETWIIRKNMMSGEEYRERYDTPIYCSPSSEISGVCDILDFIRF